MKKNSLNKYKEKSLKSIHVEVIISGSDMHLTSHLLFVHISILILIQFLIRGLLFYLSTKKLRKQTIYESMQIVNNTT